MDPDRRFEPCGSPQSRVPRCGRRGGVDDSVQGLDRRAGRSVSLVQRYAAVGRWTPRRIYTVQGGDELRQVRGQRAGVGDAVDGRVLTVQPPVDRPVPGIALGRFTLPERDGMATGSSGASLGSQWCSLCTSVTAQWMRGRRTAMSSPSRYSASSVPAEGTGWHGLPIEGRVRRATGSPDDIGVHLVDVHRRPGRRRRGGLITTEGRHVRHHVRRQPDCR